MPDSRWVVQFETSADLKRVWLSEPFRLWPEGPWIWQSLQGSWKPDSKLNLTVERNQGTVKQGDTVLGVYDLNGRMVMRFGVGCEITGFGAGFHAARSGSMVARSAGCCRATADEGIKVSLPQQESAR